MTTSVSAYCIKYDLKDDSGKVGFTTDTDLWKRVLTMCQDEDPSQFWASAEKENIGTYNHEMALEMKKNHGGIAQTSNGCDISVDRKCSYHVHSE
jgi:hypothetical protein